MSRRGKHTRVPKGGKHTGVPRGEKQTHRCAQGGKHTGVPRGGQQTHPSAQGRQLPCQNTTGISIPRCQGWPQGLGAAPCPPCPEALSRNTKEIKTKQGPVRASSNLRGFTRRPKHAVLGADSRQHRDMPCRGSAAGKDTQSCVCKV